MEFSTKSITLFFAVLLTGLSAGFFYAWAVSVIPGTKKIPDEMYLATMQSINRAILNPAFFLIFFGPLLLLIIGAIQQYKSGAAFWLLLSAIITYLIGTFGVTVLGNVPLNNALDTIDLSELSIDKITSTRLEYEIKWNRLHIVRTVFSVLSFLFLLVSVFIHHKPS